MNFNLIPPVFLSHHLSEKTPGYGGSSGVKIRHVSRICDGASSNSQEWLMSNHIGTHVDLPAHFDNRGQRLESFSANDWIFRRPFLSKIEVEPGEIISLRTEFETLPKDVDFLIIKTNFQKFRNDRLYWENNPGLSPDLGKWFRNYRPNIRCIGFDFISITSYSNRPLGRIAHKAFLGIDGETQPLRVVEDMKLDELDVHPSMILVSPVLVEGADGSPTTIIAL